METDVWRTRDAFKPGSARFGWLVSPAAIVIRRDPVNQREKVMEAIRRLHDRERDVQKHEAALHTARGLANDACANLIRTLHAIYGGRSAHGVVVDGQLYRVVDGHLVVESVEFEVLT